MWFMTSMIVSYFLFYILVYYEKYKHALMCLYALFTVSLMNSPILLPWSIDTAPLTAMLIYAGMKFRKHEYISMDLYQVLFLVLLYIGLRYVGGELNISVREYGTSIAIYFLLAIIASIVVLWGAKILEGTFFGRCFFTLGKHSLTIFSIEIAFIVLAKDMYRWIFPGRELGYMAGILEIFLTLLGGLLVSILIHKSRFLSRVVDGS